METVVSLAFTIIASLVAVPVGVLLIEVVSAITSPRGSGSAQLGAPGKRRPRIAILVPAHNESTKLLPTLRDVAPQLRAGDRVLVVADNCTDDTAAVAAQCGAEVVERHDIIRLGKGYALDFGLRSLHSDPPEVVIFIDADCRIGDNALDELASTSVAYHGPVQASYLMRAPAGAPMGYQVAEFAWRVKNWLRPLGLRALHLPCQLMGSGMAFPWNVIRSVNLANDFVVEDLKLGLDLASMGYAPLFCPSAEVTSEFAASATGARTQRERWEGGHLGLILTAVPSLLNKAVSARNWRLLALALDLAVPPLSFLALLIVGTFATTLLYAFLSSSWIAATLSAGSLAAFALAGGLAWLTCGRDVVPLRALSSIARYVLVKIGLYRFILSNKSHIKWIRTDRTTSQ